MTLEEARRAWDYALALDDAAALDRTQQVPAIEAWLVAADAAEEIGRDDDAKDARDMAKINRDIMANNHGWPRLNSGWRRPWESHRASEVKS